MCIPEQNFPLPLSSIQRCNGFKNYSAKRRFPGMIPVTTTDPSNNLSAGERGRDEALIQSARVLERPTCVYANEAGVYKASLQRSLS